MAYAVVRYHIASDGGRVSMTTDLVSAKRTAQKHGGTLEVLSSPGEGAVYSMRILRFHPEAS